MNKLPYTLSLIAMITFIACSSDNIASQEESPSADQQSVTFSAYTVRSSRSATANNILDIEALAQMGGFGVFAYEQGIVDFNEYTSESTMPNFLYNQQVWEQHLDDLVQFPYHKGDYDYTSVTEPRSWMYSPTRFYSNNAGAKHSFFAYAPYIRYITPVFEIGKAPQIKYSYSQNTDLLWARPTMDLLKPATTHVVDFEFHHALSKVRIHVAPYIDTVHPSSDGAHNEGTGPDNPITVPLGQDVTVKVKSIRILGVIPSTARLNLANGIWTIEESYEHLEVADASEASWTGDGTTKQPYHTYASMLPIPCDQLRLEIIFDIISGTGDGKKQLTYKALSQEYFALEGGHAYDFHLDLGLNSVKFSASSVDWNASDDEFADRTLLWVEDIKWIKRLDSVSF